ncbi:MAG: hypothetical protein M1824_002608 [Vezdaea acicularis]|nr:MAG: hypothetical protein M1824_002608 [Vezdaea acicularis]
MATDGDTYVAKDAVAAGTTGVLTVGGAGLVISAIQNTLTKQNVGAWGIFTRTGGTIAVFAAMGGTYEFVSTASANLREKNDTWNPTVGGFFAGSVMGLKFRTMPAVLGYGSGLAVLMAAYHYTGGSLRGYKQDPTMDEFERKEELRRNRRRPIQETIDELGEGRGIKAPGYDERRRERIRQRYGIEVPSKST